MISSPVHSLHYGRQRPRLRRRFAAALLISVLPAAIWIERYSMADACHRAITLWWQRRCMVYRPPAKSLIYLNPASFYREQSPWPHFAQLIGIRDPIFSSMERVLFCHERRAAGGSPRLVAVTIFCGNQGGVPLICTVTQPLMLCGQTNPATSSIAFDIRHDPNDDLKINAAELDSGDLSHLTVAYDINGCQGIIDGWLQNNDSLVLQPRAGRIYRKVISSMHQGVGWRDEWVPPGSKLITDHTGRPLSGN